VGTDGGEERGYEGFPGARSRPPLTKLSRTNLSSFQGVYHFWGPGLLRPPLGLKNFPIVDQFFVREKGSWFILSGWISLRGQGALRAKKGAEPSPRRKFGGGLPDREKNSNSRPPPVFSIDPNSSTHTVFYFLRKMLQTPKMKESRASFGGSRLAQIPGLSRPGKRCRVDGGRVGRNFLRGNLFQFREKVGRASLPKPGLPVSPGPPITGQPRLKKLPGYKFFQMGAA